MNELDNIDNNLLKEKFKQISEDREISPNNSSRIIKNWQ